jgi:hypothetical protein
MSFTAITEQIADILQDYKIYDLPNQPNLGGIINQSEITYAIVSGSVNGEYLNLSLNVSIASDMRHGDDDITNKKSLDVLVFDIIYKLHRTKLKGCGLTKLNNFENFTPESGKWRSLLTFTIPLFLIYNTLENNCEI